VTEKFISQSTNGMVEHNSHHNSPFIRAIVPV